MSRKETIKTAEREIITTGRGEGGWGNHNNVTLDHVKLTTKSGDVYSVEKSKFIDKMGGKNITESKLARTIGMNILEFGGEFIENIYKTWKANRNRKG